MEKNLLRKLGVPCGGWRMNRKIIQAMKENEDDKPIAGLFRADNVDLCNLSDRKSGCGSVKNIPVVATLKATEKRLTRKFLLWTAAVCLIKSINNWSSLFFTSGCVEYRASRQSRRYDSLVFPYGGSPGAQSGNNGGGRLTRNARRPNRACLIKPCLDSTGVKGTNSIRNFRELGIGEKPGWFPPRRLHADANTEKTLYSSFAVANESCIARERKRVSNCERKDLNGVLHSMVGNAFAVGSTDRAADLVRAEAVESTFSSTLQANSAGRTEDDAMVITDEASTYGKLPLDHDLVKPKFSKYAQVRSHANGVESFYSTIERCRYGKNRRMLARRLNRKIGEIVRCGKIRGRIAIGRMRDVVRGTTGSLQNVDGRTPDPGWALGARS